MKERAALAGSLIAGLLASICCIGPLVLGAIGLGSLGLAAALAPLRPWFLALTGLLIASGFYFAYRPAREVACAPGEPCAAPVSRRGQRIVLWLATILAVAFATYPGWSARFNGPAPALAASSSGGSIVVLDVQGMTCSACESEIERELVKVPGVASAGVSFERARADVRVGGRSTAVEPLIAAVERAGYTAAVERKR